MEKRNDEIEGEEGWRLNIRIKGRSRGNVAEALDSVLNAIRTGKLSGAESGDSSAYIFALRRTR